MNPRSKGRCPSRSAGFTTMGCRIQAPPPTGRGQLRGPILSPLFGRLGQSLFLRPLRLSLGSLIGQSRPSGHLPPSRLHAQNRRPPQSRRPPQGRRPPPGRRRSLGQQARRRVQRPRPDAPGRCRFGRLSPRRHHRQHHRQHRLPSQSQSRPPSWPPW